MSRDENWRKGKIIDSEMSSVIAAAHELKAPLVLIRQLSLMLDTVDVPSSDKQRILDQITLTSERALRLTSDLTRSARLEDGLFQLEPIDPQSLCEDVVHDLRPLYVAHDLDIKLLPRKHRLLSIANRDLLRRVMLGFGDNALHYADERGTVELQINSIDYGQTVRLGVRDYGPAVPIDLWRTLRRQLSVAPQPVRARPQSSGLGLYVADNFARAMKGKIGAIRHRDGATFYIDLQASRQLSLL